MACMTPAEARAEAIDLFGSSTCRTPRRSAIALSASGFRRPVAARDGGDGDGRQPDILVFDEPTTALDVTTQIEVLAAFRKLIREHGTAALYITHDLAVVAQIADRIMVLRHGKMVEFGDCAADPARAEGGLYAPAGQ